MKKYTDRIISLFTLMSFLLMNYNCSTTVDKKSRIRIVSSESEKCPWPKDSRVIYERTDNSIESMFFYKEGNEIL